jgi:hypothetical protein
VQSFYIKNEMSATLSTALRRAARNAACSRPDRPTALSCTAATDRSLSIAVCGGRSGTWQVTAGRLLQPSRVTDIAALSPSAVDSSSRPTAVRATMWMTVRGAGMFCAQIPSAGSGDTLSCMRVLLGTVQHCR